MLPHAIERGERGLLRRLGPRSLLRKKRNNRRAPASPGQGRAELPAGIRGILRGAVNPESSRENSSRKPWIEARAHRRASGWNGFVARLCVWRTLAAFLALHPAISSKDEVS